MRYEKRDENFLSKKQVKTETKGRVSYMLPETKGPVVVIHGKMQILGSYKRVKGLLDKPSKRTAGEIITGLELLPEGAEFIGMWSGRRVVGVRHRVNPTIEFADCRSPHLPPLPQTKF